MAIMLRPITKFIAMMLGIRIRRWYTKLSEKEKKKFWYNVHKRKKQIIYTVFATIGLFGIYYAIHIEIDPITGKRRLILFSHQQMIELANFMANELLNENKNILLPQSHPYYKQIQAIVIKIINANKVYNLVPNLKWYLIVIDDPRVNAMVLPNGMIIVFSGLLQVANNEEVGIVLSHEIAHCLLNHHVIRLSREHLLEMLWLIPLTITWAILPVPEAILGFIMGHYFKNIVMMLPYERNQEIEADKYGLMLAANACIDVQQAPNFWKKMEKIEPDNKDRIWWLSTHPSHSDRIKYLENLLPNALQLRQHNGCPPLVSFWSLFSLF